MAETISVLPEFPGFAVQYDSASNPFFSAIMVENLRKLKSVALGKSLLEQIAAAQPKHRGTFPLGVNVMCVPFHMRYIESGFRTTSTYIDNKQVLDGMKPSPNKEHNPDGCPFHKVGSSLCRCFRFLFCKR